MQIIELLSKLLEAEKLNGPTWGMELFREVENYIANPPIIVNVLLHGAQVVSVSGPFRPTEAANFAKIATAVGGVRVTSIRISHPQQEKPVDKVKPHLHNWK
jgi:hypothetical protein